MPRYLLIHKPLQASSRDNGSFLCAGPNETRRYSFHVSKPNNEIRNYRVIERLLGFPFSLFMREKGEAPFIFLLLKRRLFQSPLLSGTMLVREIGVPFLISNLPGSQTSKETDWFFFQVPFTVRGRSADITWMNAELFNDRSRRWRGITVPFFK